MSQLTAIITFEVTTPTSTIVSVNRDEVLAWVRESDADVQHVSNEHIVEFLAAQADGGRAQLGLAHSAQEFTILEATQIQG